MRQLPAVVVVLLVVVVVCEPPAGIGIVDVELCDDVVDGGVVGVAGVVIVVLLVVVDDVVAGGVVCANESGTAMAKLTQSAPAASNAFMDVSPRAASRPAGLTPCRPCWLPLCRSQSSRCALRRLNTTRLQPTTSEN
ncbi:MAG TPA: hypothetical protein VFE79_25885 [Paraburkholderia sp.]|nr:hypothetical protein [Paraburkholderia sp.]